MPAQKISTEQLAALNSLCIERLSSQEQNLRDIEFFASKRGESLIHTLQNEAFEEDSNGTAAYYLVRTVSGDILCYFSLKAGLLFSKSIDLEALETKKKLSYLLDRRKLLSDKPEESVLLKKDLDKSICELKQDLAKWIEFSDADNIHKRVSKTYPAIELVHFCVNDHHRQYWEELKLGEKNSIGITVFWHIIAKLVLKISSLLGVEYLFLFAADNTPDRELVNHYKTNFKFDKPAEMFTTLPIYDFGCEFLCQNLHSLKDGRKNFYSNFNATEE
ncbi:MAG: hypothetical protein K2K97_02040 [Muribaculaceae bacterium]|nr:hypothetical protein [Muribaculaceae bacterium]